MTTIDNKISTTIRDSLLNDLDVSHFLDVIKWVSLKKQGYELNFIIDAEIIQNYCFPTGIQGFDQRNRGNIYSPEYLDDEQYVLYHLFYMKKDGFNIVLDEYYEELLKMSDLAKKSVALSLTKFEKSTTNITSDYIKKYFSNDVGSFLRNISGLNKLGHLLNNNRLVFDTEDFKDNKYAQFFEDTKEKYDGYSRILNRLNPINYEDDTKIINRVSDSFAIARCLEINKISKVAKKIFIFCGDSKPIEKYFKEEVNFDYSLYCSIQQYFALIICQRFIDNNINFDATLFNLLALQQVNKDINHYFKGALLSTINKNKQLFEHYTSLRNELENIGLYKSIFQFIDNATSQTKPQPQPQSLQIDSFEHHINLLKSAQITAAQLNNDWNKTLVKLHTEASLNKAYLNFVHNLEKNRVKLEINRGKDVIESTYQLLPVFIQLPQNSKNADDYNEFLFQITKILLDEYRPEINLELFKKVIKELRPIKLTDSKTSIEVKLLKLYLHLILPADDLEIRDSYSKITGIAPEKFEDLKKNISSNNDDYVLDKILKIDIKNCKDDNLKKEYYYFASWLCRRNVKYQQGLEFAEKGLEIDSTDPRFYHSKLLIYYCMYSENSLSSTSYNIEDMKKKQLFEIIDLCSNATYCYSLFLSNRYSLDPTTSQFFQGKISEIFYNNLAFFHAELAELFFKTGDVSKYKEHIKIAREKLYCLKEEIFDFSNNFYLKLPSYCHTEAFVEFIEAQNLKGKELQEKLGNVEREIMGAISISDDNQQKNKYRGLLKAIQQKKKNANN